MRRRKHTDIEIDFTRDTKRVSKTTSAGEPKETPELEWKVTKIGHDIAPSPDETVYASATTRRFSADNPNLTNIPRQGLMELPRYWRGQELTAENSVYTQQELDDARRAMTETASRIDAVDRERMAVAFANMIQPVGAASAALRQLARAFTQTAQVTPQAFSYPDISSIEPPSEKPQDEADTKRG